MVHLVKKDGKVIGWEMVPTNDEERDIAAQIRNMQFFGMDETYPSYNGMERDDKGYVKRLSWIQNQHQEH